MLSFGKVRAKRFIQEANRRSRLKGTIGSFGKWCRSQGLDKDGKVTMKCINRAKRSGDNLLIKRATFAQNIGGYVGAKHKKRSSFGAMRLKRSIGVAPAMLLKQLKADIKFLKNL